MPVPGGDSVVDHAKTQPQRDTIPSPQRSLFGDIREVLRFGFCSSTGTALMAILYTLCYSLVPYLCERPGRSWFVAYLTSSLVTHSLHREVTFRGDSSYWRSLTRTYVIYGTSSFVTSLLMAVLTSRAGVAHEVAFVSLLLVSGTCNYVAFRHWGFRAA